MAAKPYQQTILELINATKKVTGVYPAGGYRKGEMAVKRPYYYVHDHYAYYNVPKLTGPLAKAVQRDIALFEEQQKQGKGKKKWKHQK